MREENTRRKEFEEIAMAHVDSLYNMALRFVFNKEEAEDLVQETYLKAYRFFDTFQKGTNIKAWLFKILRNTFINKYRKEKRVNSVIDKTIDFSYLNLTNTSHIVPPDSNYSHSELERKLL